MNHFALSFFSSHHHQIFLSFVSHLHSVFVHFHVIFTFSLTFYLLLLLDSRLI